MQQPVQMDANALATAMAQALAQQQQQQQRQAPPPPMTPEQIAQLQRLYNPEEQLIEMLFSETATPQTRMQALQQFAEGLRNNWRAEAGLIADHTGQTLYGAINPYLEDAREVAQERFFGQIFEGHPGLKAIEPFIKQSLPTFESHPDFPKDRSKRAEFVRQQAVTLAKQFSPDFDPAKPPVTPHSNSPSQQSQQRSSPLPSFGSGGGGQGPAAKAPQTAGATPSVSGDRFGLGF